MQKLKDKKIVIYKSGMFKDEDGFQTRGYMPIFDPAVTPNQWAYFKQLSASLLYANNTTTTKEECLFRINWTGVIKTNYASDYRVYYNGLLYQVTRVDPYEGYKRDLALYCKLTTDKLGTIIPYDPTKL